MAAPAAVLAVKAALVAATDQRARTAVLSVVAAVLTPFILIIVVLLCTLSGTANHNNAAVDLTFHGGYLSSEMPAEYRMYIEKMRESFADLDEVLTIDKMLSNEKYMGDALLQKTYTVDFLTKKKVKNRGIVPQYYIEDDHEPIIPKELFHRVQEEKARRASIYRPASRKKDAPQKGKYSSKYVLSDIMVCAECGQPYRRQVWSKYGQKQAVWRCDNRLKHGSKRCKHSPTLKEKTLHEAIMTAIGSVVEDQGEFVQAFRENVIRVIGSYSASAEPTEYDKQIETLQQKMLELIEESAGKQTADEDFDKEYRVIADRMKELKKQKAKKLKELQLADAYGQRVKDMEQYTRKIGYLKREFDDELVRRLLKTVRVINENKIEIHFRSGILITQRLDEVE